MDLPRSQKADGSTGGRLLPFDDIRRFIGRRRGRLTETLMPWLGVYPSEIDWHAPLAKEPLYRILDAAAERHPEWPCLNFLGRVQNYREIATLVNKAATGLRALGVEKGTRVGLMLPNTPHYVICYYAALKAGGIVVNYNPLYAEAEIARQAQDSDTRVMVTLDLDSVYPKLASVLARTPIQTVVACSMAEVLPLRERALFSLLRRREVASIPGDSRHIRFSRLIANDGGLEPAPIEPDTDIAVLQYTGGTTGDPKGAILTHAALSTNAAQSGMWSTSAESEQERVLGVLPLFHVFGMTVVMNAGILTGAELILLPRFKIESVLQAIQKYQPTLFPGVPTIYAMINENSDLGAYNFGSLKYCLSGGAPLPAEVKRRFEARTGCVLVEGYGLSEAGPVVTCNPFTKNGKIGSAGLPLPGTIVEVASLDNPNRLLAIGETGEICVRGPQVMKGYWKRPDEDAIALRGDRLHTGDIGYVDADGFVYLVDRLKELILVGGYNVYPRVVEEAILGHPAVAEVAVCGVPDERFGEMVKAFVCLMPGEILSAGALRAYLKDKIAPYEIPRRFDFRDSLPKTDIGKIAKRILVAEDGATPSSSDPA